MTKRTVRGVLPALLAAVALIGGASGPSGARSSAPPDRRAHEGTRAAMEALVRAGMPGVVGQAREGREGRDGRRVWNGSAGTAELGRPRAPRARDRFRIGSNTKTFVATVMLQLEAEHRLRLTDTVERWLPGVVRGHGNDGRAVSLRRLLDHTSGIFDYAADPALHQRLFEGDFLRHRFDTYTPRQLVRTAVSHPPVFAPGKGWSYSNTNYVLAGLVIEKVTGHPYGREVRERVLRPLGLRATSVPGRSTALPRPSGRGYIRFPDEPGTPFHDVTGINPTEAWAAGEMISTVGDLNAFYRALLGGRLLPARQLAEMLTTVDTGLRPPARYGLGIAARKLSCGVTVWGHDGGIQGAVSQVSSVRDASHTAAFGGNALGVPFDTLALAEAEFCGRAR